MQIGITGAGGFLGRAIVDLALRRGHEVVAFSRSPGHTVPGCEMRKFSLTEAPDVAGCEALLHLAGEPVLGLWTPAKKRRIRESRVEGTRRLVEGMERARTRPEVLVCVSGAGIYGEGGENELPETAPLGSGFLAETAQAWEAEAQHAEPASRVVRLRTPMVLGARGGALAAMAKVFRLGLGGPLGSGRQWWPWIHLEDHAMLALFALENLEVRGAVNACAPWPVRQAEFTRCLALQVRRPAWCWVPTPAVKLLGGLSVEILESRRVVPAKAAELGFRFRFPELGEALRHLLP